jgi:hypothetical protein
MTDDSEKEIKKNLTAAIDKIDGAIDNLNIACEDSDMIGLEVEMIEDLADELAEAVRTIRDFSISNL